MIFRFWAIKTIDILVTDTWASMEALKEEASRFIKAFIDIDLSPEGCVPVTGSMQGTFASFLTCGQCNPAKDTILFIDPDFPVQKQQIAVMGYRYASFDVYEHRGEKLAEILEKYLSQGNIAAFVYSNPTQIGRASCRERV